MTSHIMISGFFLICNKLIEFHDILSFLPPIRFLFGLGIRHVGINTAKDIAGHYGSFQAFWTYLLSEVEREKKVEEEKEKEEEDDKNGDTPGEQILILSFNFLHIFLD